MKRALESRRLAGPYWAVTRAFLGLTLGLGTTAGAQVCESVTTPGAPLVQDFNALAASGTSTATPPGWTFAEAGTNANGLYTAGTGSGNAGDTYSLGAAASAERALGGLQSGSLVPTLGACFTNDTGGPLNQVAVAYTGEQWRLGTLGRADRLDFQWSQDATSLTTGTWSDADALDFPSPVSAGTVGALDGNATANRTAVGATLTVTWPAGTALWIRYADFNASGADDALAVDDFSLTATFTASTDPSGTGAAAPPAVPPGGTSLLTVAVTPGTGPTSTGLSVSVDLVPIGGPALQPLFDDATNGDAVAGDLVFSFLAGVAPGTAPGSKALVAAISDAQGRTGSAAIALDVLGGASTTVAISQVYGGGGNAGAPFQSDYVELYNLGGGPVSLAGWSVQYASAAGSTWQVTPLTGSIAPGRYRLVAEAAGSSCSGAPCGVPLPLPDDTGVIAMAAASGKIALVSSTTPLSGACPLSAAIVDLVGYGAANCSETSPAPTLSNTTAALRAGGGAIDTNDNAADFTADAPDPRNTSGRPPLGIGSASPASVQAGEATLLQVTVSPGSNPPSTGLSVTADLTAIGGSAAQAFADDATLGDPVAGDGVFSFFAVVQAGTPQGAKSLPATLLDAEGRSSVTPIPLIVEPPLTAIHAVQGPSLTSPFVGQLVATRGVVTGRKSNGFFLQTQDADVDADPATSEGIFVFTGSTPPVAVGDVAKVVGTVQEFVPPQDAASPPLTEIAGSPAVTVLASGATLPDAVTIGAADTNPAGALEQLERLEGMRVRVAALRVVAPTQRASLDETNAVSTSNGVFYGVVDGLARPFREPGIPASDPLPAGAPCCVPRFDENPERLRVDSDAQPGSAALEVSAGALVSDLVGPLDFSFRTYTILPDPATPPAVSGVGAGQAAPAPSPSEFTVASFNLERFFDDLDAPGLGEPVLTSAAFQARLGKASLAIRDLLHSPDVLGVMEAEDLGTLQALAARINADAVLAGQADPAYAAYLEEGNDVGGIDSGFLVKTARVTVVDVVQVGKTATYVNPNSGASETLNDRPPLVLRALVQGPIGAPYPLSVIANHLRSLNGIDDETPDGAGTAGARVRAKRHAQAEYLASYVQSRQAADPAERIVSLGDYNAFSVNDGYVDVMGTVKGGPTPANEVVLSSPDLVEPDLVDLGDGLPPDEAYSYSFDGNTQTLDHVLVSASLRPRVSRFHHARANADFPESFRNDPGRPERLSDHDPAVAYFTFPGAPMLSLLGPNPMTVEACATFVDPGATASDDEQGDLSGAIQVAGTVDTTAVGSYVLTYSVSNGFLTATVTRTVVVVDTTPPVIESLTASPNVLWPPNRHLVPVTITPVATEVCGGGAVHCRIVSVHSDEPFTLLPDWIVTGDLTLKLRAERWLLGNGRVYTIRVRCTDASGNAATRTVQVTVPRRAPR